MRNPSKIYKKTDIIIMETKSKYKPKYIIIIARITHPYRTFKLILMNCRSDGREGNKQAVRFEILTSQKARLQYHFKPST